MEILVVDGSNVRAHTVRLESVSHMLWLATEGLKSKS